ncbi:MAG: hypothetical protein U1B80_09165 [Anaerolineaceae bacterium]|nr:hypothetical protein [Anaerolineaceae bacterium]
MRRFCAFIFGAALGGFLAAIATLILTPLSGDSLRTRLIKCVINVTEELRNAATQKRAALEEELERLRTPKSIQ